MSSAARKEPTPLAGQIEDSGHFTSVCSEFFHCSTVEAEETTAGPQWLLNPGFNHFKLLAPLRPFLQLHFVFLVGDAQKITLTMRDAENNNFYSKTVTLVPGGPNLVITSCPSDWLQVLEIWCPLPIKLIGIEGATLNTSFESYVMNSKQDLEVQAHDAEVKFDINGIKLSSHLNTPWTATITPRNAFSSESVYVEHLSAVAPTQVSDTQAESVFFKGKISIAKPGGNAGLRDTVISSTTGAPVSYETEALIRGNPIVKIKRISEANVTGGRGRNGKSII